MQPLFRILCAFGHHSPGSSEHIWYDGAHFRTPCRGCRSTLVKLPEGWVPFERLRVGG